MDETFDVVVVGGGPAGATAAGLLAKAGRQVLLLEREKFPRYHIGESLVPGVLPVLEELGLADQIADMGFVRKFGITLLWGSGREPWTVRFGESGPFPYVYEVTRAQFDAALLGHARTLGATVCEEATVSDVLFEDGRCEAVQYKLVSGDEHRARARLTIDASGQGHLLGRKLDLVEFADDLKNIAVWAYYQGGDRYPGTDAGNILVENLPDGWLWVIPLADGTQSVGWVMPSKTLAASGQRPAELLERKVGESVEAQRLLAKARRVSGFRTTRDWSYTCRTFHGPGFLLAGDAAGFVDPLFSTGVFLAMKGGSLAAATAGQILDDPRAEGELGDAYESSYHDFLEVVLSFVRFFYDASQDKEAYWDKAKSLIDPVGQMTSRQDFIQLVSGLNAARPVMTADRRIPSGVPA